MTDEQKIEFVRRKIEDFKSMSVIANGWTYFLESTEWLLDIIDRRDLNPKPLPEDLAKHREELRLMEARTMKLVSDIEAEMQKAGPVTGPIYYGEIAKLLIDWHAERRTFRGDATGEGEK